MPFDPTTAAPVDTPAFDPSTAFDPTSAVPVEADAEHKETPRAPYESFSAQAARLGKSALGALMTGTADVLDTGMEGEKKIFGHPVMADQYLTAPASEWLKANAPNPGAA